MTAAGGEVDALNSGEYGATTPVACGSATALLCITGSITIDGSAGATITVPSSDVGIAINASGAQVVLKNIEIIGTEGTSATGVNVSLVSSLSAYGLEITNCDSAMSLQGGAYFLQGVTITGGLNFGIQMVSGANANLVMTGSSITIANGAAAFVANGSINATITRSTFSVTRPDISSSRPSVGLYVSSASGPAVANVDGCWIENFSDNAGSIGILSYQNATINLTRSVIQNNSTGIEAVSGGTITDYLEVVHGVAVLGNQFINNGFNGIPPTFGGLQ